MKDNDSIPGSAETAGAGGLMYYSVWPWEDDRWADGGTGGEIWVRKLDKTGMLDDTDTPKVVYSELHHPGGMALDPVAGKIYWADWHLINPKDEFGAVQDELGTIRVGNLDGSGTPETLYRGEPGPGGIAIDREAGKLYWSNYPTPLKDPLDRGAIRVGSLDGSVPAKDLGPGYGHEAGAGSLALDPASGNIYWGNTHKNRGELRLGKLDGSRPPVTLFTGLAIAGAVLDLPAGKIYWIDLGAGGNLEWEADGGIKGGDPYARPPSGGVWVGNLDGSGEPRPIGPNYASEEHFPYPPAMNPATGKIYWPNTGAYDVRVGNLDGSGSPQTLFRLGGARREQIKFVVLLVQPVGTSAPLITGGSRVGSQLTCSRGGWASDDLGAYLYRAPQSFSYQWLKEGKPISGATEERYTPTSPGSYSCQVTASNHSGPTVQESIANEVQ